VPATGAFQPGDVSFPVGYSLVVRQAFWGLGTFLLKDGSFLDIFFSKVIYTFTEILNHLKTET